MDLAEWGSDAWKFVRDAAGKVEAAGKAIAGVAKHAGLPTVMKFGEGLATVAGPLAVAPTPVLENGQKVIERMKDSTGSGDPERGRGFAEGSRAFHQQVDRTLQEAHPDSAWSGGPAPKAYERRNEEQRDRVSILADADDNIATAIDIEASEIVETRRILDGEHQILADLGEKTQWLGLLGPEGEALQYSIETNAVYWAVKECIARMWQMHNFANDHAAGVRANTDSYQKVGSEATQQDSVGDFDPRGGGAVEGTESRVITAGAIRGLAAVQTQAAHEVRDAVSCVQMVSDNMSRSHGKICQVTNEAVRNAETARSVAGTRTAGVCEELADKLRHAANEFEGVDHSEGENLRRTMPPR